MIIDARSDAPRGAIDCDLCIIGGGPAGITLARKLDDGRRSIVLLESGGLRFEHATQALFAGATEASYPPLHATHIGALGGSTHVWAGWCRPFDPIDFERRDDVPHSGWPFERAELDPYYAQAHELLGLGPFDYDAAEWERSANVRRLATDPGEFAAALFRQTSVAFGERFAPALRSAQAVRVCLHASVLRIRYSADGRRAESVLAASAPGREFEVRPRTLVLAAGGIENARLLLISDADDRRGPANLHGTVGRHFTEHVYVDGGTFVPAKPDSLGFYFARSTGADENRRTARGAWSPTRALMREHGLLNSAIFFRPAYESDPAFGDARVQSMLAVWDMLRSRAVPHRLVRRALHAATAPHVVGAALWRRMRDHSDAVRSWRLRALCECSTDADNRVELADERDSLGRPIARLRWRIRDAEVRSIRRTHELLDEALRRAGSGHIELPAADAWRACMEPGLHHLGTTRMHLDPTQGVVDADSRVHGLDNFYVAGGSVFPTGGYANPTLTILATTLRLAAHLGSRPS